MEIKHLITNGKIHEDTLMQYKESGFVLVASVNAVEYESKALRGDKINIFIKK